MRDVSSSTPPFDKPLERGTLVRNAHGALYEVHEDMPIEGGMSAVVVDGGRTGGIGKPVWLDYRDFHLGGLEVYTDA